LKCPRRLPAPGSRALEDLVGAFRYFDGSSADRPLAGFVYGDFAELYDDGTPFTYQGEWALGYGSYRSAAPSKPAATAA
jgi:hypothetical protein